ncbi:hypothetical protein DFH27DRAFT_524335 [Peziza echinospora]|nr:hypothetical protein DFH27DRAFT_524335 [Peziza echinospora]
MPQAYQNAKKYQPPSAYQQKITKTGLPQPSFLRNEETVSDLPGSEIHAGSLNNHAKPIKREIHSATLADRTDGMGFQENENNSTVQCIVPSSTSPNDPPTSAGIIISYPQKSTENVLSPHAETSNSVDYSTLPEVVPARMIEHNGSITKAFITHLPQQLQSYLSSPTISNVQPVALFRYVLISVFISIVLFWVFETLTSPDKKHIAKVGASRLVNAFCHRWAQG